MVDQSYQKMKEDRFLQKEIKIMQQKNALRESQETIKQKAKMRSDFMIKKREIQDKI